MASGRCWHGPLNLSLNLSGRGLPFRRRLRFLALFLGFSAVADLVTFGISRVLGDYAYAWASWGSEAVSYALLSLLACQLAANMAGKLWRYAGGLVIVSATIITGIVRQEPTWAHKFMSAEIAASCYLCVALLIAWISKEGRLQQPWGLILGGIITLVGGNAACAFLWSRGLAGPMLYFVPEILGLAILAVAGWKDWTCEEVRLPLGTKKPPSSVRFNPMESRMVQ